MYFFDIGHSELVIDTQLLEFSLNNSYWICAWQHDKIQQNYGYLGYYISGNIHIPKAE